MDAATDLLGRKGELSRELSLAVSALNGLGAFWGGDEAGQAFYTGQGGGGGYQTRSQAIVTEIEAIIDGYEKTALGLQQMSRNTDQANWNVVISLPKVSK
ncbi:hypothetical protein [Thermomonospora echinospora]|nr:hypothetical protein [Thermomonospora echinospora]